MTPDEAVVSDWLLSRGYTRHQVALMLAAAGLPRPMEAALFEERKYNESLGWTLSAYIRADAERLGYISPEEPLE